MTMISHHSVSVFYKWKLAQLFFGDSGESDSLQIGSITFKGKLEKIEFLRIHFSRLVRKTFLMEVLAFEFEITE